jgi:hypothetical protein
MGAVAPFQTTSSMSVPGSRRAWRVTWWGAVIIALGDGGLAEAAIMLGVVLAANLALGGRRGAQGHGPHPRHPPPSSCSSSTGDELGAAIDDAEQDTGALADIDVLAEGTDAVEARLTTIREDLAEIASDLFSDTERHSEIPLTRVFCIGCGRSGFQIPLPDR